MNQILDGIDSVVTAISGVLYMPWVPLLLLAAGLFFTFRSKVYQIRLLGESRFRVVSGKAQNQGKHFLLRRPDDLHRLPGGHRQHCVGVSTAICLGGYGAVFWMVTAILRRLPLWSPPWPKSIKRKNKDGSSYGGPPTTWKPPCGSAGLGSSSPSSLS